MVALVLLMRVVLAQTPSAAPPTGDASVEAVSAELRRIETASVKGQGDVLRLEYQALVAQKPGDVLPRIYLAWVGMPSDESWNQLKGLAAVQPDHPWLHYGMGRVYQAWKMRDQAKTAYETALKKSPRFAPALIGLGDLARLKEDWAEAEQRYRSALGQGNDALARAGAGLALLGAGKADQARIELKQSVAEWPAQPQVLSALLRLCVDAKDPAAADVAGALVELTPKSREARRALADLRYESGDLKVAAEEYERLFKLGAAERPLVQRVVEIHRQLGDTDGEERALARLSGLDQNETEALLRLAQLRLDRKDDDGALAQLVEATARDPKRPEPLLELARIEARHGRLHEAADHYRAAAALAGPTAEVAKAEGGKLEKDFELPKRSFNGGVDAIYAKASITLGKLFEKRLLRTPGLNGLIRMRVRIDAGGVVERVDVLEDTVKDPMLLAHAYFALKDAAFPKQKREPVFEFEVGRKRGK